MSTENEKQLVAATLDLLELAKDYDRDLHRALELAKFSPAFALDAEMLGLARARQNAITALTNSYRYQGHPVLEWVIEAGY